MKNKYFFTCFLLCFNLSVIIAQYGNLDYSLDPGTGADNSIQSVTLQSDQKILIGGNFTTFQGSSKKRLARLLADGSVDPDFSIGSGFNGLVNTVIVQPDQKIIVAGEFTVFNNTSKKRILRLNENGTNDATFNTGFGANDDIHCAMLQEDGQIMIGGKFTAMNWIPRNGIARLASNGTLDPNFIYNGEPLEVTDIKRLPNGQYLVNGITKLLRLNADGSVDTTFDSGSGTNYPIQSLLIQSDGKILVGGYFTTYNGEPHQRILRLDADGMIDSTFNAGSGADYGVLTMTEQPDGQILISGWFSNFNGLNREKVARLNPDGSLDPTMNPGFGPNSIVLDHYLCPDGGLLIAGDFTDYAGVARNKLARISGYNLLGVNSGINKAKFTIFPNPATDMLTISMGQDKVISSAKVYDLSGKTVLESGFGTTSIDVSALASGAYFLSISTEGQHQTVKFLKN